MSIWFKHDAHFHEHPKCIRLRRLAGSKADSAEVGWWRIVAAAKRLGSWDFEDEEHLRDASGRYFGFVSLYREVGLLDGLTIHNAREYQAPLTGDERVAAHRARKALEIVTPDVTDVTTRVEQSREEKREQSRDADAAVALHERLGTFPSPKMVSWLTEIANEFGEARVVALIRSTPATSSSPRDYVYAIRDALRSEAHVSSKKEAEAEKARLEAWNKDRAITPEQRADNQRRIAALQAEWFKPRATA